jgi:N-acetyltransferase
LWDLWHTGHERPFVICLKKSRGVVGPTRYRHIAEEHKRLEIGSTWLAKFWQGTVVNPAAKLLLLEHAFSVLGMNRVEFLIHSKNAQSRAALLKPGASHESILRHHRVLPDGSLRDSVVFGIVAPAWPAIRETLQKRLEQYASRPE